MQEVAANGSKEFAGYVRGGLILGRDGRGFCQRRRQGGEYEPADYQSPAYLGPRSGAWNRFKEGPLL